MKKLYLLTIVILIMGILSGCGKKEETSQKETGTGKTEGTEITLMIPDWGAPTEEMLAEFKAETGITVKVIPTAWDDIKSKISVAAAGKKTPADVIEVDWSWTGEFVSAGWLEELSID